MIQICREWSQINGPYFILHTSSIYFKLIFFFYSPHLVACAWCANTKIFFFFFCNSFHLHILIYMHLTGRHSVHLCTLAAVVVVVTLFVSFYLLFFFAARLIFCTNLFLDCAGLGVPIQTRETSLPVTGDQMDRCCIRLDPLNEVLWHLV